MRLSRAVDLWMGELALGVAGQRARGIATSAICTSSSNRSRGEQLMPSVRDVTTNDCRAFLDNWTGKSPSTVATIQAHSTAFLLAVPGK